MAVARITYGGTFGGKVATAVGFIEQASQLLTRAYNMANAMGAATTPANLEVGNDTTGAFNVAAGQGAQFYTDLKALATAVSGYLTTTTVTDLDQG